MVSLSKMTEEFINKKPAKQQSSKTAKHQAVKKKKVTLYLSEEVNRALWQHRTDTGENLSNTINNLVLKHLIKKKK